MRHDGRMADFHLAALSASALRSLVLQERARQGELQQDVARLQAGLARQNTQLMELQNQYRQLQRQHQAVLDQLAAVTAQNTRLRQEVAVLQRANDDLAGKPPPLPSQPEIVPKAAAPTREKRARKKRAVEHNRGRQRMAEVTERVQQAASHCPVCGQDLQGGTVHRRVQLIELPDPAPLRVIEYEVLARRCPRCRRRVLPPPVGLEDGRIGQCRFGPRLLAAISVMAGVERLPVRQIQERLQREYRLGISRGGIIRLLKLAAQRAEPIYAGYQQTIRGSPAVNADETGWRENGQHGHIWVIRTASTVYYHFDHRRSGSVIDRLVGEDFAGTLITDCYSAYDHLPGPHQRCWSHLLRAIRELVAGHPQDTVLAAWAVGIKDTYGAAMQDYTKGLAGTLSEAEREQRARQYEQEVLALCPEQLPDDCAHATLAQRFRRYLQELFTFVRDPRVEPTNNAAERILRPLVIARKISGGTRSGAGSTMRMTLFSVCATARLQGEDPTSVWHDILLAPPAPAPVSHTM